MESIWSSAVKYVCEYLSSNEYYPNPKDVIFSLVRFLQDYQREKKTEDR